MKKTMFKKVLAGIAAVFTIGLCVPTGFTNIITQPSFEAVAERSRLGKDGGWQDMHGTEYKIEGDTLIINDCKWSGTTSFDGYGFQIYAPDIKHLQIGSGWRIENVRSYLSSIQSLKVGDNCTIDQTAFWECTALESVTIGNGCTIGGNAFWKCTALESVEIGNGCTIEEQAFWECTALTDVTIGNGCTIEYEAFWKCTALESVEIGNDCRLADFINERNDNMGNKAFWDCAALTDVTFGNNCTIGERAFLNCTALKNVIFNATCVEADKISVGGGNPAIITNKSKWKILGNKHIPDANYKCVICGAFDEAAAQAEIEKHKAEIDRIQKLIDENKSGNSTASTFSDGTVLAIIGCSTFLILCGLAAVIIVKRRKKAE